MDETLCTFLTSKQIIEKYWDKYLSMCKKEHAPFEKPLHEIYERELCISPIPSLAVHFTNINSIFGLSPNIYLGGKQRVKGPISRAFIKFLVSNRVS